MMINRHMVPCSKKKKHGKSVVTRVERDRAGIHDLSARNEDTMLSMSALETPVISTSTDILHLFTTSSYI